MEAVIFVLSIFVSLSGCHVARVEEFRQDVKQADPNKVWLFAVDGRKRPYNFLDDMGQLTGFDVDLVTAVCAVAGRKCSMVLAEFTECTFTNRNINYPGRGLMAGWFDACPGYAITIDRESGFDFTSAYLSTVSTFTVAPQNPEGFDPQADDYSNFTLTHLTGAPTNAQCLNRLKKKFDRIIIAANLPDAKGLLLNNTAQALFSPRTNITGLDTLPNIFSCDEGGAGVMVKKGSELPSWWNPAFQSLYLSGGYTSLCSNAQTKYNYKVRCLPPPASQTQEILRTDSLNPWG
ncbi:uncharacterized protein LOC124284026 [Haliotis rubra]|uniref:uncharacterized protein LOC124284026 n=1 Tax=Haliotis rubra TaxID=36100 RepID=UPI001EE537C3|nr:uncharacterized protein LOC124284026 [Haliotis rubra]XP_046576023.1 uncharacterized protein LOC124284026 [Haliotis rubra]